MAPDEQPRRIADRYELTDRIGRGGSGVVWRGRDTLLGRRVAIKQIEVPRDLPQDEREGARQRVIREARAAAQLNHRGATTVYDVVEEDAVAYIVMELVTAPTLADIIEHGGPLEPRRAGQIGLAVLDVLEVAHSQGIVHRDVKPSNVMVPDEGPVKLTDFGIASLTDDARLTTSGVVLGSPAFMAPEQATGEDAGPATDLWGLGATLYYAVEDAAPFERGHAIATLHAVVHEPHRPMQRAGPLQPVIEHLLSKDPRDRPDAGQLRSRLQSALGGAADSVPTPAVARTAARESDQPTERLTAVDDEPGADTDPEVARDDVDDVVMVTDTSPDRPSPIGDRRTVLAVLVVVLLAAAAIAWLLTRAAPSPVAGGPDEQTLTTAPATPATTPPDEAAAAPGEQRSPQERQSPQQAQSPDQPTDDGDTERPVPDDWERHTPDGSPYTVAYPPGWDIRPRSGNRTDYVDPSSGAYLRVDWTDDPAGDPYADWQAYSQQFAAAHEGYRQLRLERSTYKGYDAAVWEYVYREGGVRLHAVNLNVTTGQRGYALNFQTHAEDWEELSGLFPVMKSGFEPHA